MEKTATVSLDANKGDHTLNPDPPLNDGQNAPLSRAILLQTKEVTISTRAGVILLADGSFHIEPGELVTLTGPSRSGKSAFLHSLAGLMKPTGGEISINGVSLYPNLKAFRSSIGFVHSEYTLQQHLTATEILMDASRLRLPRSTSAKDRQLKAQSLLETAGLTQAADTRVSSLGKLDKRRLSIAVELMGDPGLLLVDTAADGLTPFEELQITTLLRELSRQGLTIIQVNHLARCVGLSDKVIFLAPGGSVAWFGPVDEALTYFHSFTPANSREDAFGLEDAIGMLANPQAGAGAEWARRFKAHPAYQKYVDDPLNDRRPDLMLESQPLTRLRSDAKEKLPPAVVPRANSVQQFMLLVRRNFRLLWRGKTWLWMLAVPLLAAMGDFVLSSPTMLDPQLGDPARPPVVFGVLVFMDLFIAALLFQNEIFKEKTVHRHEWRTTPLSFPYILSKIWLVAILAIYQGLVWSIVHFAATGMTGGFQVLSAYFITFFLVAFIGGILGLTASALSTTAVMTTAWVLILTVPQLFLGGSIIPLAQLNVPFSFLSVVNPSRYAFETLLTTSGYGLDVGADPCWKLPADQRNSLSDVQKQGCSCMGDNLFSTCRFPGIQALYSFVIEQPKPAPPQANSAINAMPVQPLPKPGETLDQFAAEMSAYTGQLELYLGKYDAYLSSLRQYPDVLANWQRMRSLIIGNAEGLISAAVDHYGQGFNVNLVSHWSILAAMSLGLVILLIGIQYGKSVTKT